MFPGYLALWQIMRRQMPAEDRRALLEDKRFGVRYLAALVGITSLQPRKRPAP